MERVIPPAAKADDALTKIAKSPAKIAEQEFATLAGKSAYVCLL